MAITAASIKRDRDTELKKLNNNELKSCIKLRYQIAAHNAEIVDQALRLQLDGKKPDRSLKTLRKEHVIALDALQAAIEERDFRTESMR